MRTTPITEFCVTQHHLAPRWMVTFLSPDEDAVQRVARAWSGSGHDVEFEWDDTFESGTRYTATVYLTMAGHAPAVLQTGLQAL